MFWFESITVAWYKTITRCSLARWEFKRRPSYILCAVISLCIVVRVWRNVRSSVYQNLTVSSAVCLRLALILTKQWAMLCNFCRISFNLQQGTRVKTFCLLFNFSREIIAKGLPQEHATKWWYKMITLIWLIRINICYLPAERSVWWKTVTEVLKMLRSRPRSQFFTIRTDP